MIVEPLDQLHPIKVLDILPFPFCAAVILPFGNLLSRRIPTSKIDQDERVLGHLGKRGLAGPLLIVGVGLRGTWTGTKFPFGLTLWNEALRHLRL
ncbi:hypothetical protein D3C81_991140 [compost metagenome]